MARLRYNFASGSLGASLTNVATTITFAAAPPFATLSGGDYIALTLVNTATPTSSEVVYLTAYTSGATTGTITRAQEGTSATSWSSGARWEHAPTVTDFANVDAAVQTTRTISTTAPIAGGGDLSANRTLSLNVGSGLTTSANNLVPDFATAAEALAGTSSTKVLNPSAAASAFETRGQIVAAAANLVTF